MRRYKVSCELALRQLNAYLDQQKLDASIYATQFESRSQRYRSWRADLRKLEAPSSDGIIKVPYLMARLRDYLPKDTAIVAEAVTNSISVLQHLNLTEVCIFGKLVGT